ncbi:MAG: hypothetical protein NT144_07410 [Bacteroidia bacterium]|nr:hypothetical protein [Bacteroidia bacterium]
MEKLYFNLSEEEFSKERKILLWGFAALFFLAGAYILVVNLVLGQKSIPVVLSAAPFGISLVVFIIAGFATFKGTDLFFLINDDKIEYKFGMIKPATHSFKWIDIKELVMPHKQKKVKLIFKDGSSFVIDLTWIQKKKSSHIRKHIFHAAREKDLNVIKVMNLAKKG